MTNLFPHILPSVPSQKVESTLQHCFASPRPSWLDERNFTQYRIIIETGLALPGRIIWRLGLSSMHIKSTIYLGVWEDGEKMFLTVLCFLQNWETISLLFLILYFFGILMKMSMKKKDKNVDCRIIIFSNQSSPTRLKITTTKKPSPSPDHEWSHAIKILNHSFLCNYRIYISLPHVQGVH